MKTTSLKRVGSLLLLLVIVCVNGQAKNQKQTADRLAPFYYNCTGAKCMSQSQTICKPDESGKYLKPHRKYNFTYDEQKRVTSKEAYKWDTERNTWIPDYKQTFIYSNNRMETLYAKWNRRKKLYNPAKEKTIYQIGRSGTIAYTSYKKEASSAEWTLVTDMPDLLPNRLIAEK